MKNGFYSGLFATGISLAAAFPAMAEISAQEVRDLLVDYYAELGAKVTIGSEESSGGVLTLTDMNVSFDIPDSGGQLVVNIDTIGLRETGSGAVVVELPENSVYGIGFEIGGQQMVGSDMNVTYTNFESLVSGEIGDIRIESSGDGMSMSIDSVSAKGQTVPVTFNLDFGAFDSDYTIATTDGDENAISSKFDLANLALVASAKDPSGGSGFFSLTANIADIISSGDLTMASYAVLAENPLALFDGNFAIDIGVEFGASDFDVAFKDGSTQFAMTASSTGGLLEEVVSKEVISFDIVQEGVDVTLSSSDIPFPSVKAQYDELSFGIEVPLKATGTPSDFSISAALRGLTVGESIWAMVDPGQTIPRDPATVAVALSGKAMVLVDILNVETLANIDNMDGPPMLPLSVSLDELQVSFGGAKLTGDGSAEFNFEDPVMLDGVPLPVGAVNLKLTGAFGLIDKIAGLGLLPPEVSLGARGIIGAFATPVGDDAFESKLEVTEDGAIMANGQRVK
ncbi:MAG: DUF2125 domain-containing protein [Alphaproteobacteria bacterium]|nr:DUF2125 domain-containing protein [Alphaproteobacteria bacterium]